MGPSLRDTEVLFGLRCVSKLSRLIAPSILPPEVLHSNSSYSGVHTYLSTEVGNQSSGNNMVCLHTQDFCFCCSMHGNKQEDDHFSDETHVVLLINALLYFDSVTCEARYVQLLIT